MTYREIMLQILSEMTDLPREEIEFILEEYRLNHPEIPRFDVEFTVEEARRMMNELRQNQARMLNWLASAINDSEGQHGHA